MPIVYMHGVNTRSAAHFAPVREYLRRIVAPAISSDPESVSIEAADWFQFCPKPKWDGISRPRTILLGAGAGDATPNMVLDDITATIPRQAPRPSGLTSGQPTSPAQTARIDGLSDEALADLITVALRPPGPEIDETDEKALSRARIGAAADTVARDPAVRQRLREARTLDEQLKVVGDATQAEVERRSHLAAAGALGKFVSDLRDRVTESLSRTASAPAAELTVVAGELRPTLNAFATRFLGDVLCYMAGRGTTQAPGPIPLQLIAQLKHAQAKQREWGGEPIVLLTHSMGGQIAYDVISSFLPVVDPSITVDFWCATASQVGFFEELNLFLASSVDNSAASGRRVPFPSAHLGHWWNVWDHNDIISFTTTGIFADGIDDEEFWTGKSVAAAHGGYLERPSFYRRFADKLEAIWPRPGG